MTFLGAPAGTPFVARARRLLAYEAPAKRLAAVRIFVGIFATVYLLARLPSFFGLLSRKPQEFAPTGVLKLFSAAPPAAVTVALVVATLVMAIPFTAGFRFRVTAPIFAVLLLVILTLRNSFGMVFHTENLLVVHVGILALTDAAAGWSLDARKTGRAEIVHDRYGFALQVLTLATAIAYLLAGIAKIRISGMAWATSDILRNQVAYDNARKMLLGDSYSPFGAWAVRHAWIFPPFAALTLVFELGSPVALLGGRVARVWALGMWSFHVGVLLLMWIFFPYPVLGVAFATVVHAERPIAWLIAKRNARKAHVKVVAAAEEPPAS